jgi:hypothetical protein
MHRAELTDILIPELAAVREMKDDMGVQLERILPVIKTVPSLHPKVGHQSKVVQHKTKKLSSPLYTADRLSGQQETKLSDLLRQLDNAVQMYGDPIYLFIQN